MKIYVTQDREGNVHITDNIDNCPTNLNLVRFYEHVFPGVRRIVINIDAIDVNDDAFSKHHIAGESNCDICQKEGELYHNEKTGLALCEGCDMDNE